MSSFDENVILFEMPICNTAQKVRLNIQHAQCDKVQSMEGRGQGRLMKTCAFIQ